MDSKSLSLRAPPVVVNATTAAIVFLSVLPAHSELAIVDAYVGKAKAASIRKTPLAISGQSALLLEKLDSKERALARLFSWGDKLAVEIDQDGDGYIDSWELYSNDAHIRMSAPANDFFNIMDVVYLNATQRVVMRFTRQASGEFALRSRYHSPLTAEFEESVQGLGGGNNPVEETTDAPLDVRKRISLVQEKMLDKSLKKILAPTQCGSAKKRKQLETAIARVALSANSNQETSESKYLVCMREHGLEGPANFISSRFFSTVIPETSASARWSVSCQTCEKGTSNTKNSTGICKTKAGATAQGVFRARGAHNKPEVTFISNAHCRGGPCEPNSEQLSRTFLHEMLHAASVGSEEKVEAIVQCCAPAAGQTAKCAPLERDGQKRERTELYLSLYFNLKEETRQEIDKFCARLPARASDRVSGCPLGYISTVAEAHQNFLQQNKATSCKTESSAGCQAELAKIQKQIFAQDISSRCGDIDKSNQKAVEDCQSAVGGLDTVIAATNTGSERVDFAQAAVAVKNAKSASVRHQLPTGQMADAAGRVGQTAAESTVPDSENVKVYTLRGPAMATKGFNFTQSNESPGRAKITVADVFGKQVGLIDSVINRIGKLANVIMGTGPAQARNHASVPDPSRVGMSAHMRKLLTPKAQAGNERNANPTALNAQVSQSHETAPASNAARDSLVNQMTGLSSGELQRRLDQKNIQKALADHNIGVIDQNGARHDRTQQPSRWLIYDEESGRLRFLNDDAK